MRQTDGLQHLIRLPREGRIITAASEWLCCFCPCGKQTSI